MQIIETTDPDVASEIFREHYSSMDMQVDGTMLFRIASTPLGRARLDRTTLAMRVEGAGEPLSDVYIVRIRGGTVDYEVCGSAGRYRTGDTCYPVALGLPWSTRLDNVETDVIALDATLIDEAGGADTHSGESIRLLSRRPGSRAAEGQLWRLANAIATNAAVQLPGASPLVTDAASRLLAAAVLTVFPHDALLDPTIEDRHDAHPATVRRAISYIESHCDEPISVVDVARAAYVTPRALQLAFRRHLGTTPMAHLRRVRLEGAHAELQSADPDGATIAAIANRWGFTNPSRFAAQYRLAYGRPPSTTLEHRKDA